MKFGKCSISAFIFLSISSLYPQFKYQIDAGTGFSRFTQSEQSSENALLVRLEGNLEYNYEDKNRFASALVKLRPDFLDFKSSLSSIKLKTELTYLQSEEEFNWGINLALFKNIYDDLTFNIYYLTGETSFYLSNNITTDINLGYAYQDISSSDWQKYDLVFINPKIYNYPWENIKTGYGVYAEHFTGKNSYLLPGSGIKNIDNNGWRFGPHLSFNYFHNSLINFDYRFLFHQSEFTLYPSYEHILRFVAGKIFFIRWSAFILIDYYARAFKQADHPDKELFPLYVPLNNENKIYLKIGYDLFENLELYVKSGFFNENLYNNRLSIQGWDTLIGIALSN